MRRNPTEAHRVSPTTWYKAGGAFSLWDYTALQYDPSQLVSALELLLPTSKFYSTLSLLPPPDPTAPMTTTTQVVQTAVHNTLPVLLEIVEIVEKNEREIVDNEVRKARTRLDSAAMTPEAVRRSVGTRVWSASKVYFSVTSEEGVLICMSRGNP